MELLQFGKLAYDLNIPQDNKSLSAVEDAFYVLSDRRPCLALKNKTRPPSAEATHKSSRSGGRGGSNPGACLLGAAAAAAAASGGAFNNLFSPDSGGFCLASCCVQCVFYY